MPPRRGVETSEIRASLLDAAQELLIEEGCGALTARRLADAVGLSRPSVHYYFGTIDELIVGLLSRRADLLLGEIVDFAGEGNPFRKAWNRRERTSTFTFEIMTMGLRRPVVRDALRKHLIELRTAFSQAIAACYTRLGKEPPLHPDAMATSFLAVSQALMIDRAMDIDFGHAVLIERVEAWLNELDGLLREAS